MSPLHCKACDGIYDPKNIEEMLCPTCKRIALGYGDDDEATEFLDSIVEEEVHDDDYTI